MAIMPNVIMYSRLQLLGLPREVRDEIWQAIYNDINASAWECSWHRRPITEYEGLSLTCHQIHNEIAFFWPRTIIQQHRVTTLAQPTVTNIQKFKQLAIEIPHNSSERFFLAAAASLKHLAPLLQDLRIFFVGSDRFHVPFNLAGCGIHGTSAHFLSKRLTIDGQNHSIRQPLFVALRHLSELRSLVLSNHNYPILIRMVLEHKSRLKQLHLVTDERTMVHRMYDPAGGFSPGLIIPLYEEFPPVHSLNLTANASLHSLQLAATCTKHLRHLTWTVPDPSLQSGGGTTIKWYRDTANLLHVLRRNSKQLHTLRICFHETIHEKSTAAHIIYPAFEIHLEHLPIKVFELHIDSQSPWFGREVLQYLPHSLRRLCISRELIDEDLLTVDINDRYMACYSTIDDRTAFPFAEALQGAVQQKHIQIGVGEEKDRCDYISFEGGRLGFIGFEYEPTNPTRFGNGKMRMVEAEETKTRLLMLNGRLLDRERNMHLADYGLPNRIPLPQICFRDQLHLNAEKDSIAGQYAPLWVCTPPGNEEVEAANNELKDSIIVHISDDYFGNEEGAAQVFRNELTVAPYNLYLELPERTYPEEASVHSSDEHWQTDCQPRERTDAEKSTDGRYRAIKGGNVSQSAWEQERVAHWVRNGTWYSRNMSSLDNDQREASGAEGPGQRRESIEHGPVVERKPWD